MQVHVDLVDKAAPTGQIRSAFLRIRCQLKPASWHELAKYGRMGFRRYQLSCDGLNGSEYNNDSEHRFWTNVDIIPTPELLDTAVFLMPVTRVRYRSRTEQVAALVLRQRPGGTDLFERIGRMSIGPAVAKWLFCQHRPELPTLTGVLEGILQYFSLSDGHASTISDQQEITLV